MSDWTPPADAKKVTPAASGWKPPSDAKKADGAPFPSAPPAVGEEGLGGPAVSQGPSTNGYAPQPRHLETGGLRPFKGLDAAAPRRPQMTPTALSPNRGTREDGTNKGPGWLGSIPAADGKEMTELSFDFDVDGKNIFAPLLVPTLSEGEVALLASGGEPTDAIYKKAQDFAIQRLDQGKSPFKEDPRSIVKKEKAEEIDLIGADRTTQQPSTIQAPQFDITPATAKQKKKAEEDARIEDRYQSEFSSATEEEVQKAKSVNQSMRSSIPAMEGAFLEGVERLKQQGQLLTDQRQILDSMDPSDPAYQGALDQYNERVKAFRKEQSGIELEALVVDDLVKKSAIDEFLLNRREHAIKAGHGNIPAAMGYASLDMLGKSMAGTLDVIGKVIPTDQEILEFAGALPEGSGTESRKEWRNYLKDVEKAPTRLTGIDQFVTPEYVDKKKDESLFAGGLIAVAEMAPAIAAGMATGGAGMGASFFTSSYRDLDQEMQGEYWDQIPEAEKEAIKVGTSFVSAGLSTMGMKALAGKLPVVNDIFFRAARKFAPGMSPGQLRRIIDAETKSYVANVASKIGQGFAIEGTEELADYGQEELVKHLYENYKRDELGEKADTLFQNAESIDQLGEGAWKSFVIGGIAGNMIGGSVAALSSVGARKRLSEKEFGVFKDLLESGSLLKDIEPIMAAQVAAGEMSQSDFDKTMEDVSKAESAISQIPEGLDIKATREAFDLLLEKDKLKTKDKILSAPKMQKIDEKLQALVGVPKEEEAKTEPTKKKAGAPDTPSKTVEWEGKDVQPKEQVTTPNENEQPSVNRGGSDPVVSNTETNVEATPASVPEGTGVGKNVETTAPPDTAPPTSVQDEAPKPVAKKEAPSPGQGEGTTKSPYHSTSGKKYGGFSVTYDPEIGKMKTTMLGTPPPSGAEKFPVGSKERAKKSSNRIKAIRKARQEAEDELARKLGIAKDGRFERGSNALEKREEEKERRAAISKKADRLDEDALGVYGVVLRAMADGDMKITPESIAKYLGWGGGRNDGAMAERRKTEEETKASWTLDDGGEHINNAAHGMMEGSTMKDADGDPMDGWSEADFAEAIAQVASGYTSSHEAYVQLERVADDLTEATLSPEDAITAHENAILNGLMEDADVEGNLDAAQASILNMSEAQLEAQYQDYLNTQRDENQEDTDGNDNQGAADSALGEQDDSGEEASTATEEDQDLADRISKLADDLDAPMAQRTGTPIGDTKTVTVDGKERTVFNSNGKPIHPTVEGVRNFWKWFGDSKVVDDKGRPLVVYHGTTKGDTGFNESIGGIAKPSYWTPRLDYGIVERGGVGRSEGSASVIPAYLKIENPKRVYSEGRIEQYRSFKEEADEDIADGYDGAMYHADKGDSRWQAIERGPSGWGNDIPQFVVFDPTQIKSATGNNGDFDPSNPSILAQRQSPERTALESAVSSAQKALDKALKDINKRGQSLFSDQEGTDQTSIGDAFDGKETVTIGGKEYTEEEFDKAFVVHIDSRAGSENRTASIMSNGLNSGQAHHVDKTTPLGSLGKRAMARGWGLASGNLKPGTNVYVIRTSDMKSKSSPDIMPGTVPVAHVVIQEQDQSPFEVLAGLPSKPIGGTSFDNSTENYDRILGPLRARLAKAKIELAKYDKDSAAGEAAQGVLFQIANEKDLIVQHNLSEENLQNAARVGGLAAPSLAVTKTDHPAEGFGEITLLGDVGMVDPKGPNKTKVFGGDIYSPRYPEITYHIKPKNFKAFKEQLAPHEEKFPSKFDVINHPEDLDKNPRRKLSESVAVMAMFLHENGKRIDPVLDKGDMYEYKTKTKLQSEISKVGDEKYSVFIDDLMASLSADEKIFMGFTNNGRRYVAHNLENVVRILKKDLRGGENFFYGSGSVRASLAPQFRTVKAIKSAKELLISKEKFEALRDEVNNDFSDLSQKLAPYSSTDGFRISESLGSAMSEAPKIGLGRSMKEYGFKDVPSELMQEVREFMGMLATMPTEYFEAKIIRGVQLQEFRAAVIPKNTQQRTKDILRKRGLDIYEYDPLKEGDRKRVVQKAAKDTDVAFQKSNKDTTEKTGKLRTDRVAAALKKLVPNLEIIAPKTKEEYAEATKDISEGLGSTWGIYDPRTNKLYLNPSSPDLRQTFFHEAAHPIIIALAKNNPELFSKFYEQIRTEKGGKYIKFGQQYSDLSEAAQMAEALAEFFGDVAAGKVPVSTKPDSLWQQFKEFIKDILAALGWDMRTIDLSKPQNVRDFAAQMKKAFDKGIAIEGFAPLEGSGQAMMQADQAFNGPETPSTPIGETKTVTVDGKEHTVFNSNGKPIHPTVEGVRNFWKWFGDSKVVNKDGAPVPMYHGGQADFDAFNKAFAGSGTMAADTKGVFFFTDRIEVAEDFAGYFWRRNVETDEIFKKFIPGANIMQVYLKMDDPAIWGMGGAAYEEGFTKSAIKDARKSKEDGVVFQHMADGSISTTGPWKKSHVMAVFKPTQIKSATGNYGTFDPRNPSVLAQRPYGPIPADAHKAALNAVAASVRAGEGLSKAITNGLKEVKASDWYKTLDATQQAQAEADFKAPIKALATPVDKKPSTAPKKLQKQVMEAVGKKPAPKIVVNEKAALKDQLRMAAKNIRGERTRIAAARKEFVAAIKEAFKGSKGDFTAKQAAVVAHRAASVDPTNDLQVSRFLDYANKVIDNAEWADQVERADIMRGRAAKASKRKSVPYNHKEVLKQASEVDPAILDNPGEYTDIVQRYLGNVASPLSSQYAGTEQITEGEFQKYLSEWEAQMDQKYEDLLMDELGITVKKGQAKEIYKSIQEGTIDEALRQMDDPKLKAEIESRVREMSQQRIAALKQHDTSGLDKEEVRIVKDIASADIDRLTVAQQADIIRASDNIILNNGFGGATLAASIASASNAVKPALDIAAKSGIRRALGIAQEFFSQSDAWTFFFGQAKDVGKIQNLVGFGDYVRGKAEFMKEQKKVRQDMEQFFSRLRAKYKDADSFENMTAEWVAGWVIQAMPKLNPKQSFEANKAMLQEDINRKMPTKSKKEAEMAQTVFDKIIAPANTREEALALLAKNYPSAKQSIDFMVNLFKPYRDRIQANSVRTWNMSGDYSDPYYLPKAFFKRGAKSLDVEPYSNKKNLTTMRPGQAGGTKARMTYRSLAENRLISPNIRNNVFSSLSDDLYGVATDAARMRLNEFMKMPDSNGVFGNEENKGFMAAMMHNYITAQDKSSGDQSEVSRWVNNRINSARTLASAQALAGFTQITRQLPEAVTQASVMMGRDFPLLFKNIPEVTVPSSPEGQGAANLMGNYAIGSREHAKAGMAWEGKVNSLNNAFQKAMQSGRFREAMKIRAKIQEVFMMSLMKGDLLSARAAWLGFYEKARKMDGHEVESWQTEASMHEGDASRQDAALYADTMVNRMTVSSDPAQAAKIARRGNNPWENASKAVLQAFVGTAIQQVGRRYAEVSTLGGYAYKKATGQKTGEAYDPKRALMSLVAGTTGNAVFLGSRLLIASALREAIGELYKWAVDDDDDEEPSAKAKTVFGVMTALYMAGMMDSDIFRAIDKVERDRGLKPKDPESESVKKYKLFKSQMLSEFIGSSIWQIADDLFIDGLNRMAYSAAIDAGDPSVFTKGGDPKPFRTWLQDPKNAPFYRYGQTEFIDRNRWLPDLDDAGILGVYTKNAGYVIRNYNNIFGNDEVDHKNEYQKAVKDIREASKERTEKASDIVARYEAGELTKEQSNKEFEKAFKGLPVDEYNKAVSTFLEKRRYIDAPDNVKEILDINNTDIRAKMAFDLYSAMSSSQRSKFDKDLDKAKVKTKDFMKEFNRLKSAKK